MFVIRINPANSENLYSLFTVKIQISLGKRAFIFILKILTIWNELRWMTDMNQFSWKHGVGRMEPAQGLVMLPISCFPCSQRRHQCMEDRKKVPEPRTWTEWSSPYAGDPRSIFRDSILNEISHFARALHGMRINLWSFPL